MYKSILILTLFILSIATSFAKAEILKQIEINGNKRVSDETIKVYGEINSLGSDVTKSDINKILKNLYNTEFFENVSLELKNNKLIISLKEYPVINQLIFTGVKSSKIEKQLKEVISLKEKGSFIETNLNKDINIIKKLYSSIGNNFAKIEPKIRKIDNRNVDLIFEIEPGDVTKISKITFTGDKKIRDKRLRDVIASEEDKFWKFISRNTSFNENLVNLDKRLLTNYYKSLGYYDVEVSSSSAEFQDTGNININYTINAGNRFLIKKISTNVDKVFDKKLFFPLNKTYNKFTGQYYSPFKIKKILEEVDELIESNNLQFVEHQVEETIENDTIILTFNIFEGEKILVEKINILGNSVTNENVIRSELLLDEGDPFTNLSLDKSIAKIKSRNIFNSVVSNVQPGTTSDLKVIDIRVEEKPTGEISAGAGVGTNGGSFAINVTENNWLGEGKNVSFNLDFSAESLKGELVYANPNYDLLGNSLNYRISNTSNDKPDQGYENNLISTGIGTSFEQYKDINTNLGVNLSYDDLKTSSTASSSLKKQSGQFVELAGTYGFSYDQRNRAFMPTNGSIIGFSQTLPVYADKPFIKNTFSSSSYHSFSENVIGAGKIYLSAVNGLKGEDVRVSKRNFISTKKLRGFESSRVGPVDGDDHVGGNYVAAVNLEANLPKLLPESSNADVGLFLDMGNVWGVDYDASIDDSNKIRASTGVNVGWISPLGPLSFVFATNLSKASTDKTESFNFNLGTSF